MRTLDRKLVRELRRHWVQVASIALVMGCGTMTIMGLRGTLASVRAARDDYFTAYRFADVFARVQRAPASSARRLETIPGVASVQTRIVRDVKLDVPGLEEPAVGHVVSIPEIRRPMLNDLHIRRGRWIAPGRDDEVLISDRFAEMNGLNPGDHLAAVINGRWQRLTIAGVALSPEFVVEFAGGMFVDNRRYGIVWTSARALEAAFDMKGVFNDVAVRLAPGANEAVVVGQLDAVLRPWGGAGAHGRADQAAARTLEDEFAQLETNATLFPMFFLVVAAFLLNVVLSRLVTSQRDEIAALKAFGYSDREIGTHYLGFGVAAVLLGAAVGVPLGMWMGANFTALYADYFRFPTLPAKVDWGAAGLSVGISGGFALLGALGGVRRVMKLTPAESLRPEAPARFRPLILERLGVGRLLSPNARMVLRNLERRPLRTGATVIGVALAVALLASGRFPYDAFDRLFRVEFGIAQQHDLMALFVGERPAARARAELTRIDGVIRAEPFRSTSVRISRGAVRRTTTVVGLDPESKLYRLTDFDGRVYPLPSGGAAMTAGLARILGVHAGDTITVELLDRGGETRRMVVAGLFDPMIGQGVFVSRDALNGLLREQDVATGAYLSLAAGAEQHVLTRFKDFPGVVATVSRAATMRNIDEQMRESMVFVLTLIITSACVIAMGVVYNSARIALSERGRELASLRVLGFTTNEVSGMLLGEQAAVMVLALPVGTSIGAVFSYLLVRGFETERFHFPYVVAADSQAFAMATVVVAGALAGLVVRRRVGRLDMVSALRTRE
jgi:putative ABC transport system permease protein